MQIPGATHVSARPNFSSKCTKPLPSAVVKHWGVFSEFDSVG